MKNVILIAMVLVASACGRRDGRDGAQGQPGSSCTVNALVDGPGAPNGGSIIECTDGSSSLVLNGQTGSVGSTGASGLNGSNGTSGTVIAPVKFCPGVTTYPSTFVEVGFCIYNKLYAVYSYANGFMSEIPPGNYSSTNINASCSFTVGSNCSISH